MTITVHTREKELSMRYARENNTAKLHEGRFTYLVNGGWIGQDEFDRLYPIPVFEKFNNKGANVCKVHDWLK